MTPSSHRFELFGLLRSVCLCLLVSALSVSAQPTQITRISQLPALAAQEPETNFSFQLEGVILWANSQRGELVIQDDSGIEKIELDLNGHSLESGVIVRMVGQGTLTKVAGASQLGSKGPVVDNDGLHGMIEKSGAVFLKAGRQPIRLVWFNGVEKSGLDVEYEGPGLPRQKIPDAALFLRGTKVHGLAFNCYEGLWESLQERAFSTAAPVKTGTVFNFDLSACSHDDHVALEFTGELDVPRDGLYRFNTKSDDGSQLFVGTPSLTFAPIGKAELPAPARIAVGAIVHEKFLWSQVEGQVTFVSKRNHELELELRSGTAVMRVEIADASAVSLDTLNQRWVRLTGVCEATHSSDGSQIAGTLLVSNARQIQFIEAPFDRDLSGGESTNALPLLTSAVAVHRLKREEALRGYPVRIRGVLTCVLPEHQAFTIQDSTRGIYVEDFSSSRSIAPRIGEFVEIQGTTDPRYFAPIVNVQHLRGLGIGQLPEPVRPTWDQLVNGSLDAQYVEIQGIITGVHTNGVTLLMREGRIRLELRVNGTSPEALAQFEDAVVRVRGCLFATWDYVTHEVKPGEIRIYGADISVDQPAPEDLFSLPRKNAEALLLFDPQAGVFQRVKVAGQIVFARDPDYFLVDGKSGLRFAAKKSLNLKAGDNVEVVGFPELSGASPLLREAVARKVSEAALPEPRSLSSDDLLRGDYDSTRVRLEAVLVNVRETRSELILELQHGVRTFVARMAGNDADAHSIPVGSKLELTGIYSAQGGNRAIGKEITSFELLLNSASDVRVLARPSWWTLKRLLFILGALALVLAGTVLWISQLHRQVEERTVQLAAQIEARQREENLRAMEQERARVAQDLHDELGSGLTEITMLAARTRATPADEKRGRYLEQMGEKAREMVTSLDEIVWAMNPRHDSLASMVSYFCLYAEKFLGLANIAWRLEGGSDLPDLAMDSRHRHQLFLAFKEALTNVVRHAGATEVRLMFALRDNHVLLSIADNGRGFAPDAPGEGMDGVINMRARIEKLGGRFEISGEGGRGTVVKFFVPAK